VKLFVPGRAFQVFFNAVSLYIDVFEILVIRICGVKENGKQEIDVGVGLYIFDTVVFQVLNYFHLPDADGNHKIVTDNKPQWDSSVWYAIMRVINRHTDNDKEKVIFDLHPGAFVNIEYIREELFGNVKLAFEEFEFFGGRGHNVDVVASLKVV